MTSLGSAGGAGGAPGAPASPLNPALLPAPSDFPAFGITLRGIQRFLAAHGDRVSLLARTTESVCRDPIIGLTAAPPSSYCDMLLAQGSPDAGAATVFVSHAWRYRLGTVVQALEAWEGARLARGEPPSFFWLDLFTNSQHKTEARAFSWWQSVFAQAVARIGHTLLVLQWSDPIPLRRAWCIFEIGATLRLGARLEVVMPPDETAAFLGCLNAERYQRVYSALTSINVQAAEATVPEEARAILATVAAWAHGPEGVDAAVSGAMQRWMLGAALAALARLPPAEVGASAALYECSRLALRLGRLEQAEALGRQCLAGREGAAAAAAAACAARCSLADVLLARGDGAALEEAGALYEEVLRAAPGSLHAAIFLARARTLQGRLACADAALAAAAALNPRAADARAALQAREGQAALALARGAAGEAAAQLAAVHADSAAMLGAAYPSTLGVRCALANALSVAGRLGDAQAHFEQALADQERVLGGEHRDARETRARLGEHRARAAAAAAAQQEKEAQDANSAS